MQSGSELLSAYVAGVVSGEILACRLIRRAAKRHLCDLEKSHADPLWPYEYRPELADRAVEIARLFPHVKGKWAKIDPRTGRITTIDVQAWQAFVIGSLFGWVRKDNGKRRFRTASIYVPRKNAKSTLAAIIGWIMFAFDDEPGAEVYSGATSEKQAFEVFGPARQMAIFAPHIAAARNVGYRAKSLYILETNSKFMPIIGKPRDGASPHCSIIDEYHEHKTSKLKDSMETGMMAREQPLSLVISTAGDDIAGPCKEDWDFCEQLLNGVDGFQDETHFAVIYTIDKDDAWDSMDAIRKANPNFGVSVFEEQILSFLDKAKRSAGDQSTYKTKHLNVWVGAKDAFFNVEFWMSSKRDVLRMEDFSGRRAVLGVDFANKDDLTSIAIVIPDGGNYIVFCRHYIPQGTVAQPFNKFYRAWRDEGWLTVTPGNLVDYDVVQEDMEWLRDLFYVQEAASDPNRAWAIYPRLEQAGLPMVEYMQNARMMSEPMKTTRGLINDGRILHNGDPILSWAISNVVGTETRQGTVRPEKNTPRQKIDPAVSLLMAIGRLIVLGDSAPPKEGFVWL